MSADTQQAALDFAAECIERHPSAAIVVLLIDGKGDIGMGVVRAGDVGDADIVFALEGLKQRIVGRAFGGPK